MLVSFPTLAAAPRLQSVSVSPNPVPIKGDSIPEVIITVVIERPSPLELTCEASIDPGDGGRGPHVEWTIGDRRTKTTRYTYRKPGTYKLVVAGSGGKPCTGKREVSVTVGGAAAKPKPGAAAAQCPKGWTMAKGATADRFTCEKSK